VAGTGGTRRVRAGQEPAITTGGERVGHRTFRDAAGVEWQVWDTYPSAGRVMSVAPERAEGWLCFARVDDTAQWGGHGLDGLPPSAARRRLSPVPADWEAATQAELLELLARAELRPPRD
jgi:hypothetical protein